MFKSGPRLRRKYFVSDRGLPAPLKMSKSDYFYFRNFKDISANKKKRKK